MWMNKCLKVVDLILMYIIMVYSGKSILYLMLYNYVIEQVNVWLSLA